MNTRSIADLVLQARRGEATAFAELHRRFAKRIYLTAFRILEHHQNAEEVANKAWHQAHRYLHKLVYPEAFGAWVSKIAGRLALNVVRAEKRRQQRVRGLGEWDGPGQTLDGHEPWYRLSQDERRALVRASVAELKPADYLTLRDFYYEYKSLKQSARERGLAVGSIKRSLFMARAALQKKLQEKAAQDQDSFDFAH